MVLLEDCELYTQAQEKALQRQMVLRAPPVEPWLLLGLQQNNQHSGE
jgi:hypothetical protein